MDLVVLHRGEALQNIGEVILRIDAPAAATLDDRINDSAAPTGIGMTDEEPAAASDR